MAWRSAAAAPKAGDAANEARGKLNPTHCAAIAATTRVTFSSNCSVSNQLGVNAAGLEYCHARREPHGRPPCRPAQAQLASAGGATFQVAPRLAGSRKPGNRKSGSRKLNRLPELLKPYNLTTWQSNVFACVPVSLFIIACNLYLGGKDLRELIVSVAFGVLQYAEIHQTIG